MFSKKKKKSDCTIVPLLWLELHKQMSVCVSIFMYVYKPLHCSETQNPLCQLLKTGKIMDRFFSFFKTFLHQCCTVIRVRKCDLKKIT